MHSAHREYTLFCGNVQQFLQNGVAMQKVNIYLDDELWAAFRIACLQRHISASQQIGLFLVQFLHEQECQGKKSAEAKDA